MKLIFYGRHTTPPPTPDTAMLTIEQKGVFSFSIAAVQALGLTLASELVLASDVETNAWFLTLQVPAGEKAFELRPRDRKHSKALVFHSLPQARAYWKAHGLTEEKSVRSLVSATAVEYQGVKLYPLTPQHPTTTPTAVATPVVESSVPAEQIAPADVAPLPTDLPHLQAEQPATPPMVDSTPVPVSSVASLNPDQDLDAEVRLEQLTDKWYEADITGIEEPELTELIDGLSAKGKNERDIVENAVLNRAKTERARRIKKGAKRG